MPNEQLMKERHIEQLKVLQEKSLQSSLLIEQPGEIQEFNYYQKIQHPLVDGMLNGEDVVIEHEAEHAHLREETRHERKKREQREHKMEEAREKTVEVKQMEADIGVERTAQIDREGVTTRESVSAEKKLLKEKLEAIRLNEDAALETAKAEGRLSEAAEREIRWSAQADRAAALGDFARVLKPDTRERSSAMERKEKEELKADNLRRLYEVTQIAVPAEREREEETIKRHAKFDVIKSVTKAFGKENPLTHEDAVWEQGGRKLVNMGRAFFGGTKPMYIFEDRNSPIVEDERIVGYKRYLFKTAVNCLGFKKPEGALVTEAAATLQRTICGENSIPAFAAVQDGTVLGSFQEKIEQKAGERIDLFKWQANPVTDLPQQTKDELLREHLLDWLLCNFDTKGENFLQDTHDNIISFDKEASFSFLTKDGAQHMDTDYVPHSNNTIYNVMFKQFAEGHIDLNLQKTEEYLGHIEDMSRDEYMRTFSSMLTQKYGETGEKNTERKRIEDLIWNRKDSIRAEYSRFYGDLLKKRLDALGAKDIPYDHANEVSDDGSLFKFAGDEQRVKTICEREQMLTGVVPNVTQEQLQQHGGASFHQVRSKEEAERLVADSHGFMYMKEAGHGMYELRPTMPETANIDGKEIRLRRNYNRFVKMIVRKGLDAKGELRPDALKSFSDIVYTLTNSVTAKNKVEGEKKIDSEFRPILDEFSQDKSIFGEDPQQGVEEFVAFIKSMILMGPVENHPELQECTGSVLINGEAEAAFSGWFAGVKSTTEPLDQRVEKIRKAMQGAGATENQISEKIKAVTAMYGEAEASLKEMVKLRDMDTDSPDIALVNACSSNAYSLSQIVAKTRNEDPEAVQFFTWTHIQKNPREIIDWLKDKQAKSDGVFLSTAQTRQFEILDSDLAHADECTEDQAKQLYHFTGFGTKYEYHKAPVVATSQNQVVTYETFAPETSQLTVSPFTHHIAVGVYNHGTNDMKEYYKLDNPLASDEMMERIQVKDELRRGKLPGDK